MKKIITILSLVAVSTLLHAQGYIEMVGNSAGITTNGASLYNQTGGTSAKTPALSSGQLYYYALLFDATTPGAATPNGSGWTLATVQGGGALLGTNYVVSGAMAGNNGASGVQVNMAAGTTYNVELVGWSATLGTSWSQVLAEYGNGTLAGSSWTANGFFGFTSEGTMTPFATAGAGDPTVFPSTFPNGSLTLYGVSPVPEPASIALAGLGGLALLGLRRKK